jgi:hypothetical protein
MLHTGLLGRSLVSEQFNTMCTEQRVEARVQASPNPGDPWHAMRLITLRNFNNECVTVFEQGKRKRKHVIPPKGELQIAIAPNEEFPIIVKGVEDTCPNM